MCSFGEPTTLEEMGGWMEWSGPQPPGGTSGWKNSLDFKLQRNLAWGVTGFVPNRNHVRTAILCLGKQGWMEATSCPGSFWGWGGGKQVGENQGGPEDGQLQRTGGGGS